MKRRDAIRTLGIGAAAAGSTMFLQSAAAQSQTAEASTTAGNTGPAESEIGYSDGSYILPPLPYAYDALEPHIDEQTMRLHHDIHHAGYVKGANKAVEMLNGIATGGEQDYVGHWEQKLAFNLSGHHLHTLFWNNMKPDGGGEPSGPLADAITRDFGSFSAFKSLFQAAAGAVEGSGWGILAYDQVSQKLVVNQAEKHMNLTATSASPILAVDVWEHAYYLKYQNKRGDYVAAFFEVINWDDVTKRFVTVSGAGQS